MKSKDRGWLSLLADIGLVMFLTFVSFLALLVGLSSNLTWNMIYLAVTVVVMTVTYFYGLIPGMLSNLLFVFGQMILALYINVYLKQNVPLKMAFWLILPGLLSGALAMMMSQQQRLQSDNHKLRRQLIEQGVVDIETNLRSLVAFTTDAQVYIENHRRFGLPVTMVTFKVRYYREIRRLLSDAQNQSLLRTISNVLAVVAADNQLAYFWGSKDPTWGMIGHLDQKQAQRLVEQLQQHFTKAIDSHQELHRFDISLTAGIACWDATMNSPYDLMRQGMRELEYDV
ncbi:diguanylate cyclase [Secundilactobacillus pentosiphilus]|uniref:Diguanylate cyclase n=1 Tax=Secundilactobacillus pentosiphilus TaxID=1714682 RepID=A0A1Z5IU62_9LACO|nr:diguanylate cyclase [Secundilactobacillus pentosiphilus]GAX05290.1 diguanylate cyclase [Secundilactobacillus pentosiphilus]